MSQTIDKINSCYPLFEQDEYQELFRNKRQLEEAHDAQRVQEVFAWTTTAEYEALNFQREALTVDPAKACQPLGAVLCSLGFANTLPYVHGSQGCVAYFRTYFNRHFKEPIACVSDSMTEDAAVFGGNNNMNLACRTPARCTNRRSLRCPPPAWRKLSATTCRRLSPTPKRWLRRQQHRRAPRPYAKLYRQPRHRLG